ncbi:MAG: alginate export family protein [Candidatus Omnitrophica bacterium]|nr:alginate export family protein [Candidatus Omnitrophota bacterium]
MFRKQAFWLTLVLCVALAVPAFAAVENVKLSGDITIRGLYRDGYTLGNLETSTYNGGVFAGDDDQKFFMSTVRLRVDADLTENISAEVELMNQRDIDAPSGGAQGSPLATNGTVFQGAGGSAANDQFDVILNLANITIKELYYPELSVKIGRQNIQWGEGFAIGSSQLGNPDPSNTISADEFSMFNSFDAITARIDNAPWHFDLVAAKVREDQIDAGDDHDLVGINVGRVFDAYSAEGEIYTLLSRDRDQANNWGDVYTEPEVVYAIGLRGSVRPWDRLKLAGEVVWEFGEEGGANGVLPQGVNDASSTLRAFTLNGRERQNIMALAYDLRAEWDWLEAPWPTKLGLGWVFYSGEDRNESDNTSTNYRPLFRGKYYSAIREFQGQFYFTDVGVTPGYTNQHQVMFDASFHPFNNQDLTFFTRWLLFWLDEVPIAGRGKFIGNELDMTLDYAYTEDLTFGLIGAFFWPGDYFDTDRTTVNTFGSSMNQATETAKEVVGTVSLAF